MAWSLTPENVQRDIADFLRSLPLEYDIETDGRKFKLVHAAPMETYNVYSGNKYATRTCYCVWNRDIIHDMPKRDYTLIFGHTLTVYLQEADPLEIWHAEGMVGIDCGAGIPESYRKDCITGRLACLRLEDMKEFYSDVKNRGKISGFPYIFNPITCKAW